MLGASGADPMMLIKEDLPVCKLQEETNGIYGIIRGALDLAEKITELCTSSAVQKATAHEFCDEAFR